jgi:hypothetical protein
VRAGRNISDMTAPSRAATTIGEKSSVLQLCRRAIAHWHAIILLVILALATWLVIQVGFSALLGLALLGLTLLLIFIASQIFWIRRSIAAGERLIPGKPRRAWVAIVADLLYLFLVAYSFPTTLGQGHTFRIGFYRMPTIVTEAVFWWWFIGSLLGFVIVNAFGSGR